ncbi:SCO1/SenC [Musa troglodytarum]|uniref:SCO1/SenC n=1 Tax=Musa troglodytarum TaxID=320322 RepID=A0A9E7KK16_9LILI|nr:SCO1/SenC [Musa troglodytarum]
MAMPLKISTFSRASEGHTENSLLQLTVATLFFWCVWDRVALVSWILHRRELVPLMLIMPCSGPCNTSPSATNAVPTLASYSCQHLPYRGSVTTRPEARSSRNPRTPPCWLYGEKGLLASERSWPSLLPIIDAMSKIKGLKAFIGLITHGRYSQNMILSSANRTSSFSDQCLVRSVTTSERTNGKISAAVASDEKNGTGDSDQTASQKPVRGGTASSTVKQGPSVGTAAIGGPFKLVNHYGKMVTEKDFLGKWTLIYFGFTYCPDICPDELQKLAAAVDKIKAKTGMEVVPVFISVDPERDNVEQVHEYVKEFHPDLIGLTGTTDEIRQVARAFRVYYMKTEEEGSDYLVDHSIVMYLMNPNMEFVKFFGKNYDTDALTEGVIKEIKAS